MAANDVEHGVRTGDIEALDKDALAKLVFDEVRLAPLLELRDDDVLAAIQEAPRRVQPDEAHAASNQNQLRPPLSQWVLVRQSGQL